MTNGSTTTSSMLYQHWLLSTTAMRSIASLRRTITVHCTVNDKRTHGLTPMSSLLSPEEDNAERCVTSAHNMCVTNALGMHCVTRITLCSRDTTQRCHTLVTLVTSAHSIPVHSMMNALQTTNRTSGFITTSSWMSSEWNNESVVSSSAHEWIYPTHWVCIGNTLITMCRWYTSPSCQQSEYTHHEWTQRTWREG